MLLSCTGVTPGGGTEGPAGQSCGERRRGESTTEPAGAGWWGAGEAEGPGNQPRAQARPRPKALPGRSGAAGAPITDVNGKRQLVNDRAARAAFGG